MKYLRVPREVALANIKTKDSSWSAGMYRQVEIPTGKTRLVRELLHSYDKGSDPGSLHYLRHSTHYFIRTKALQSHSYLISSKGDAITPINPRIFKDMALSDGDILLSKDSNIGECAMVDGDLWRNHTLSGGVVRLRPSVNRYYLFAFLKHPLFVTELSAKVPRGATIAHANELWLDCRIPFPNQNDADEIVAYVAALAEAIVDKEKAIRGRDAEILRQINDELSVNQAGDAFRYEYPSTKEVRALGRLDAAIYSNEYKSKMAHITNYLRGSKTPSEAGFTVTPGASLEMKLLQTRINSEVPKPGFYKLLIPANISEYGTMNLVTWLGTARKLPLLRAGDILFGEAGFHKGRSIVLIDEPERATTNAHGLYARRIDGDLQRSIFFRCIFNWYRSQRLIDLMAVGGSGGHFSPNYFDFVRIPSFPEDLQARIALLYHNPAPYPAHKLTLANFADWHRKWNQSMGIWELDREMKALQQTLAAVQELLTRPLNTLCCIYG
jgi:type I restriction enzyme S subunit